MRLTLGHSSDAILLVMRLGLTDKSTLKAAKLLLAQSRQRVLGLVVTGTRQQQALRDYIYHNEKYILEQSQLAPVQQPVEIREPVEANGRV